MARRPKMKPELRLSIWRRDNYTCQACGLGFPREKAEAAGGRYAPYTPDPDFRVLEIDHITPYSRGGTNDPDNLQCLCDPCNRAKRARTFAMFWPDRIAAATAYLAARPPTQHTAERAAELLLGEHHHARGPLTPAPGKDR